VVVDSSVILAVYFDEARAEWAVQQLNRHRGELYMSTVNLTEVLIRLEARRADVVDHPEASPLAGPLEFIPPDETQARIAAEARLRYPLNLGDCFTYALAVAEDDAILTLDGDFRCVDREVLLPPE